MTETDSNQINELGKIRDAIFSEVFAEEHPGWKVGDALPDDSALIAEAQALAGEHMILAIQQMQPSLPTGPNLTLVVSN